ncbi:2-hydroxyacid dehydrogenase [Actinomadura livida]|uniref:2-hydroxyacid dehydrogenase n=1 Tax=Actinomadura livida TaxID=79909 RepID=A0A7W7IK82_9ACTN|nr:MULTISPECIES: 2-hydroxyacid dehydrogenase [Actinomadura]MBB4778637.1 phosphoglycerate dehydrogenase-like enzyme [Actinomadura catellatispora]GGU30480.1 glyoxylate reductase [Actinomadura livida]
MRVLLHYDMDHTEPGLDIVSCSEQDDERFAELLPDTEVLWHVLRPLTAADMDRAPKLRLVQKLGTGVNTIDLAAAGERGIAVANMPGQNAQAVAETSLLLMLGALRRVVTFDARTRAGRGWPADRALVGGELAGRTVGLLGGGEIAGLLRGMLEAVGATVRYTSRTPRADPAWRSLDELLRESDIVSVHVPLTEETRHMLDAERLAMLPEGAIVVNTARGAVVDEAALIDALKSGHLGGAGLDVFEREPVDAGNPLLAMDNVVVMPHVAWLTGETWNRYFAVAAENCRRLMRGDGILHRVV